MKTQIQNRQCINCKHLRIKDFVFGLCRITGEIRQPVDSCEQWEEETEKPERDFYTC